MKFLTRVNREVAVLTDGEYAVRIYANEGVDFNLLTGSEPVETIGEALLIGDLLTKSSEKTFYVFYDNVGLRITENHTEAPDGALVIDDGQFFEHRVAPEPPPVVPVKWKFRKPPRSRR